MLYSRFMVMSFPFVSIIERNERQKKLDAISLNKPNVDEVINKNAVISEKSKQTLNIETNNRTQDMVCLSNLEEIVFFTSTSRCLLDEMKTNRSTTKVDYDKYLEFFE
jgi:hypothetical protein